MPLTTVAVGSINDLNICRIESQGMKEPNYVEFASTSVEPGEPKWANYIKGVVACFHGSNPFIHYKRYNQFTSLLQ